MSLFTGERATPPSDDFIMRNAMTAQEVAVGWWPGDPKHGKAAFYAYAYPPSPGYGDGAAQLTPDAARWDAALGEYVLHWDDVVADSDPRATTLGSPRSAMHYSCSACGWDPALPASAAGNPPPLS